MKIKIFFIAGNFNIHQKTSNESIENYSVVILGVKLASIFSMLF